MNRSTQRFEISNLTALLLLAILLTWLSRHAALDAAFSAYFYDPAARQFPLAHAPLFSAWGHAGLQGLLLALWIACVGLMVGSRWHAGLRKWRAPLVLFLLMTAGAHLVVAFIKASSVHSCPSELAQFGGVFDWSPLFGAPGANPGPGGCWPGGHAAGGFSLIAGYFALRDRHPAGARWALACGLALGALMSVVQVARGANFATHNLWSLWIVWAVSLFTYLSWKRLSKQA